VAPAPPPDPTAPGFDPTSLVGYDAGGVDPGEATDVRDCDLGDPTGSGAVESPVIQGWFVDHLVVYARRDFAAAAAPGAPRLPLKAEGPDLAVNLLGDKGSIIDLRLDPATVEIPSDIDSVLVSLDRRDSADAFTVAAVEGAGGVWSTQLAVDEPELLAGVWDVSFFGARNQGGTLLATRILTVNAQDQAIPVLRVLAAGSPVHLGPGSFVGVEVTEAFLRRVTYSFPGLPTPTEMPFPYVLPVTALPEGPTTVRFTAEDRTGHAASLDVPVDRDTLLPYLTISGPQVVYSGVPFELNLTVIERSAHTIHLDANGTLVDFSIPAGQAAAGKATKLLITAPGVGNLTVKVLVNDTIGNQAVQVRQFTAVKPVTDLRVSAVRLATPATNTAKEGQGIVAVLDQVGGVAPLPVTVTFKAGGQTKAFNVTVPASGPFEVRWDALLPPGIHEVLVHVQGPAIANETSPGNEDGALGVESFLGRVTIGPKVYSIRSDARGLPVSAVLAGTSKTFPLTIVDSGKGVAYAFTVDNRTIEWDPLVPIATLPAPADADDDGGKDAPFPGLMMSLLVVALAALVQRRQR
jgi:hypothetical protein